MNDLDAIAGRIAAARKSAGLSTTDAARAAGLTASAYYDLEAYDDEVFTAVSLGNLCRLSSLLGVTANQLLGQSAGTDAERASAESLISAVRNRISSLKETAQSFGERVGWDVESALANPTTIWEEWNVAGLRDVCGEVGIPWADVLASWDQTGDAS